MRTKRNRTQKNVYTKQVIPPMDKDICAEININAVKHNLEYLKKTCKTELIPVLKADAYGHGIVPMSKVLRMLGIKYIGVATLGEAILLRKSGDTGRVLAWLYDIYGDELTDAFKLNIDIAIFDETHIPIILKKIPASKKIKVTVFVDTGINRSGIPYDKALDAFLSLQKSPNIQLEGLMSHLVCSEIKNSPIIHEQLRKFRALRQQLETIGIKPPLVHIANTGGCLNYDVSDFTLSRPGAGIYGINPRNTFDKNLRLAMTAKSYILQIKEIDKGEGVGYNWKYKAPHKMKICVVAIGYADIIPRDTSLKLNVYINGTKRKVLGLVSMDQIIIESKNEDKINDEVIIFGDGTNCKQTIYDVAKIAKTLPIEILCRAGYRINRTYVKKTT